MSFLGYLAPGSSRVACRVLHAACRCPSDSILCRGVGLVCQCHPCCPSIVIEPIIRYGPRPWLPLHREGNTPLARLRAENSLLVPHFLGSSQKVLRNEPDSPSYPIPPPPPPHSPPSGSQVQGSIPVKHLPTCFMAPTQSGRGRGRCAVSSPPFPCLESGGLVPIDGSRQVLRGARL